MKLLKTLLIIPAVSGFAPCPSAKFATVLNQANSDAEITSRRNAMASIFFSTIAATKAANALDMDAFMNAELASDTKNCDPKRDPKCVPKLAQEEALCKYGQGGKAKAEACKSIKAQGKEVPSAAPQGKSLGGAYAM